MILNLFYTACGFFFMYKYWKRSNLWRYKEHTHDGKFLDHDIALHSLLVTNIPTEVSLSSMSAKLKFVFEKIFPDQRVISAKAVPRFDELYIMANKLKTMKKDYRYYKRQNKKLEEVGKSRKVIKKRRSCCGGSDVFDAEEHTKDKIRRKIKDIKKLKDRKLRTNGGFGFVTFISNLQVKKCLYKNDFKQLIVQNLSSEERIDT